ncbi:hypothetical protein GJV85_03190 [Sulfurimonas aquatica]|uniref:Uncharacterized protein n=1 Tax=Sulfurimonas aquatica TaxID=2672570 RepID=A0A975AYY5_9BACT|nr:hypothetical protein [Sulfurimonas aquatica]QSZ41156.1 hypothetical protein GJV85_03190 [Sulfurimonas aquatica]
MFDFLDSDWFNIGLEIVFVILISYDIKKYIETKKREYITNIVLTVAFAIWTLYPYYNSYVGWDGTQKEKMLSTCVDSNDSKLCKCMDDKIFKEYVYDEYIQVDHNSSEYREFLDEAKEDCLDDGWF